MRPRRFLAWVIGGMIAAAMTAGCGGAATRSRSSSATVSSATTTSPAAPTASTICSAAARAVVTRRLGPVVRARGSVANSGYPACAFAVRVGGRPLTLGVEVDTEPSAYAVLERTIEEQAQGFPARTHPAPIDVPHVGLGASWFPEEQQLQTTDGARLVIVTLTDRALPLHRRIAVTVAVARTYLRRPATTSPRGPAP